MGLIKLGNADNQGTNKNEVMISCNLGGDNSDEDNYINFDNDDKVTTEMGTSYDPPRFDDNCIPNTTTTMFEILEQEMLKGFGGGVPTFLQGEVHRLTQAK